MNDPFNIPMDGMIIFPLFLWSLFLFVVLVTLVFSVWMFIHVCIRTFKMWPRENILNIIMIIFMWVAPGIGAVVYYFVCYRTSHVLAN